MACIAGDHQDRPYDAMIGIARIGATTRTMIIIV
jgi:hypothetical protein